MRNKLEEYCRRAKVCMEKASAENPKLNGATEAAVKTVKNIFKKSRMDGVSREEALFLLQATP